MTATATSVREELLAQEAEKLMVAYGSFLIKDTEAWKSFCANHRGKIVAALRLAAKPADGARSILETARQEIVLAIAFLGRDTGTERMIRTVDGVLTRLARADEAIRSYLSPSSARTPDPGLDRFKGEVAAYYAQGGGAAEPVAWRTFDTTGTILTRSCNTLTITCENGDIANRVADQLRTATPPVRGDRKAIAKIIHEQVLWKDRDRGSLEQILLKAADAILSIPVPPGAGECGATSDDECKAPKSTAKTCLDGIGLKITNELYKAVSGHTGDACLLAMIGSWGDTLDDPDILAGLQRYNEMGECFIPDASSRQAPPSSSEAK